MKGKKLINILLIIFAVLFPVVIFVVLGLIDIVQTWNSWGVHEGKFIYPNFGSYMLLLVFKFSIYLIPPFIIAFGQTIENNAEITQKKYIHYLLRSFNVWFLFLLVIKLLADSIFELDRIFGITLFDSIKDVQTLIGYILTVILKRTIKLEHNQIYEKQLLNENNNK